jgi:uncharacterized protein (TIGR03083 family)
MTVSRDGADAVTLPSDLRDRVLAASRQARPAGRSAPAVPDITPVEAFARAADAFHALLVALDDPAWSVTVLRDLDVQALVGHLTGVEEDVHRCLAGDPSVADADHVASTDLAASRQAGRRPAETRAEWRQVADRTLALVSDGADLDAAVSMHGMRLPLGDLLVVRAFELWTHENDIRRATGLPASAPDAPTLQLMTSLAVRLLPHGVSRLGEPVAPVDVHLVLTGPGGGTWDLALGDGALGDGVVGDEPADGAAADRTRPRLSIVADAVEFCRLVADRVDPAEIDLHVTGATDRTGDVLRSAAALALD